MILSRKLSWISLSLSLSVESTGGRYEHFPGVRTLAATWHSETLDIFGIGRTQNASWATGKQLKLNLNCSDYNAHNCTPFHDHMNT